MKLRWHSVITTYEVWDDRYDCFVTRTIKSVPVLQYFNYDDSEWVTVPNVEEDHQ